MEIRRGKLPADYASTLIDTNTTIPVQRKPQQAGIYFPTNALTPPRSGAEQAAACVRVLVSGVSGVNQQVARQLLTRARFGLRPTVAH